MLRTENSNGGMIDEEVLRKDDTRERVALLRWRLTTLFGTIGGVNLIYTSSI